MGAKNCVIAGDFEKCKVINTAGSIALVINFMENFKLNKTTVEAYELVDEEKRTSVTSAVSRGLVGSLVLGPVGLLAGLSAKKKGINLVAIQFKNGKKSLLEIDDSLYKTLVKTLF
ncbi:hypothetical protein HNQ80_004830 [Anaerosolibacter carboniphilus]|uniref:Uncharacterized protein n=1 Tax=Anaerosolibacter carboniphilus TaxID=1417629 RepID=A0A841KY19_9FIRM|nr:hypothetical protein [Anaerosolibacter carboniphilus]MBB6218656.1 hypothetical protein [Anaerosolibacter carboniphilus]